MIVKINEGWSACAVIDWHHSQYNQKVAFCYYLRSYYYVFLQSMSLTVCLCVCSSGILQSILSYLLVTQPNRDETLNTTIYVFLVTMHFVILAIGGSLASWVMGWLCVKHDKTHTFWSFPTPPPLLQVVG